MKSKKVKPEGFCKFSLVFRTYLVYLLGPKLSNLNQRLKFHVLGPKMGPFQFLRNGFLIERDAKTLQTCHKLLFYHDLFIMAGILLASSIELILPKVYKIIRGTVPLSFICCLWDMHSYSLKILVYVDNMRHLTSKE